MANLLERAIDCDDGDDAGKLIRDALGIESDEVANYMFPKTWPANRARASARPAAGPLRRASAGAVRSRATQRRSDRSGIG